MSTYKSIQAPDKNSSSGYRTALVPVTRDDELAALKAQLETAVQHGLALGEQWHAAEARALAAESKLARLEGLERAAREAAAWFREYEALHAAKGSIDGDAKARTNAQRAERIEAALAYASENGE